MKASLQPPTPFLARRGFWLSVWLSQQTPEGKAAALQEVMSWLEKKIIVPHSGEVFPLTRYADAIALATQPGRGGKVLMSN